MDDLRGTQDDEDQGEAVSAVCVQLAAELDTFVGRESELAEARRQLQANRLLTLTGPPGVGKTRLSRHLIVKERPAFSDGVFFADLVDVSALDLHSAVARAVGILDNSPNVATSLIEFARQHQSMLLVLDNCEELVEPVRALVSMLLQASPQIRILCTSRVMLGARGEHLLPVPPLPTDQAVRLLIDRGQAVRPEWTQALREADALPDDDLEAARQACRLLDGVPLAIEMVAAWLDVMSIQETVDHLNDRFRFLIAEESEQPNHRSMRAALDSSYVLLAPTAQRMWKVAATFAGGFDLAAAESVAAANGMDTHEVLTALTRLVRHSVLTTDTAEGRTRYRMLETTRVYGKHLIDEPDLASLRQAHTDHYVGLVAIAADDWFSAREIDWLHQLIREVPNLRLALEHLRHHGQAERELRMVVGAALTMFQIFAGQMDEARRWLTSALARYPHTDELRVSALALAAWISLVQGASDEWPPLLEQCRQAAHAAGCEDTGTLLFAEATRVWLTEPQRGAARESITMFVRAAEIFDRDGQRGSHYMAVQFAAFAACFLGDRATATRLTADLVAVTEDAEAPWTIAWARWACALLELIHGEDLYAAMGWAQQALEMAWRMGDTWLPTWGVWLAACIAAQMGKPDLAALLFGGARQRHRRTRVMVQGLLPWWQVQQQAQKLARSALGDEEFEAQLIVGDATSYDDMIELALQSAPRPHVEGEQPEQSVPVSGLSRREQQVAEYVTQEWKNRDIAEKLGISTRTVEVHVASLIRKLNAGSRVGVAVKFAALGERS